MVLVDTSIWVAHLREGVPLLKDLLLSEGVLSHPFIIGELALGHLKNRREILSLLHALPEARSVENDEILEFIETRRLAGSGIGLIDAHLLASALLTGVPLWTQDGPLRAAASRLRALYR